MNHFIYDLHSPANKVTKRGSQAAVTEEVPAQKYEEHLTNYYILKRHLHTEETRVGGKRGNVAFQIADELVVANRKMTYWGRKIELKTMVRIHSRVTKEHEKALEALKGSIVTEIKEGKSVKVITLPRTW